MSAMLSVSLWFALVTVVPGLFTLGTVRLAMLVVSGDDSSLAAYLGDLDEFHLNLPIAVAAMIITQVFGILLEERLLIPRRLLGRDRMDWKRVLPASVDPYADDHAGLSQSESQPATYTIDPYTEYRALYLVLTSLGEDEDPHGHLQRIVAQFFLTLNSLVALIAGIAAVAVLVVVTPDRVGYGAIYAASLLVGVIAVHQVAANRFALMGWGLWATRRRRARAGGPARI
jgi:hypothetical protein